MLTFIQAGGFPMLVVIVFGLACLAAAIALAVKADATLLPLVRALTTATSFAVVSAVCADLMAVFWTVPGHPVWSQSPDFHLIVMRGLGEALSPAVMGCTMMAVAWSIASVGIRRARSG